MGHYLDGNSLIRVCISSELFYRVVVAWLVYGIGVLLLALCCDV
jgi:hypothetical protein